MNQLERYQESLRKRIAPGEGCHGWIMSTANYGTFAGLSGDQMFSDLRSAIPEGKRRISDREIQDAVSKALSDHQGGTFTPRPRPAPIVQNGAAARQRIIDGAKIADEADLWEASPLRLWDEPKSDHLLLLATLYQPNDRVFIGDPVQPGITGHPRRS